VGRTWPGIARVMRIGLEMTARYTLGHAIQPVMLLVGVLGQRHPTV
jgi:hypothetical protein